MIQLSTTQISDAFGRNVQIIKMQTAGLSHAQSLVQLPFRGNCLNWIIGHILANREFLLAEVSAEAVCTPEIRERYLRDSEPVLADGPGVVRLEHLLELLNLSQQRMATALAALPFEDISRERMIGTRTTTLNNFLFFHFFHDCYHTGQTEILRQAAGTDDKVI